MNAKLCECGCGLLTAIATKTSTRDGTVRGQPNRFIHAHHIGRGSTAAAWKGGRSLNSYGYVRIHRPDHPRSSHGYVLEHIIVAEAALGKALVLGHPVHHVDENRANNVNSNLVICEDENYHDLLHVRARALDECGHADWRQCRFCKDWAAPATLRVYGKAAEHAECHKNYDRQRQSEHGVEVCA